MRKKLAVAGLAIVIALLGCVAWLLGTSSGARFLLARAQPYLPQELTIGEIRGTLVSGIDVASLDWNSETVDVAIRDLFIRVEVARLLSRQLAVRSLDVGELDVVSRSAGETESTGALPSIDLPIEVSLDASSLRKLTFTNEDSTQALDEIQVSASMKGARLDVTRLVVRSSWLSADLDGRLTLAGDYPGRIRLHWKWSQSPSQEFTGQLEARGDLRRYDVEHVLQLPHEVVTEGRISYVDSVLEFDLANNWADFEWPVGDSLLTTTGGTLELSGNPSSVDVSLDTRAGLGDLPETQVNLKGILDPQKIRMSQLDASNDFGRLAASGDVRWQPALAFDIAYSLEDLSPSLASKLLTGQVDARGMATGEWIAGSPSVTVIVGALDGQVNDQPLGGGGTVRYSREQLTVTNGRVELGGNRIGIRGAIGDRLAMNARVDLPAIRELLPDASGSLSADIELRGTPARPEGRLEASGIDLSWSEYAIANLDVDTTVSPAQDLVISVNLEKVLVGENQIDSVNLAATGSIDRHTLRAELLGDGNRIAAEASGAYQDDGWTGSIRSLLIDNALAGTWSLGDPAELVVSRDTVSIAVACLERTAAAGQACIQADMAGDRPATFDLAISDVPLSALPLKLPAEVTPRGLVDIRAEGSMVDKRLTGDASIALSDAKVDAIVDDEPISVSFTRATANVNLADNRAQASLRLELADGVGSTALDVTVDDIAETGSAVAGLGTVDFNDLTLFAALLPDISQPSGNIDGNLEISGSLGEPELLGALSISDGSFGFRKTGVEISDINARLAQLAPGRLQIDGSARSGDGEIKIRGDTWVSADAGIRSEFLITGQDFELSRLPDWQVAASPSIAVVLDDRATTVTGNLFIPKTDVRVKDIPDAAQSASPDVIVHRGDGAEPIARRRIDVDIAVALGEDVRFAGFGLSTAIEGAVRVRGGTHAPYAGAGRLSLRDGRYMAYGQELEIERGQLIFNGPLDNPQLDVRAVRRMTDVTAGIQLSGTPAQLQSSLYSEPPLGDAETLSYLLTGRPLSSATGEEDGDMLNAAAFALGVSSAGNIVTQVRTGLGLDTLAVEGGADDSRLIAGKRFGQRLFVEYGYGLIDKLGTLLLRYQLSERIILESRTGTISNFDILYSVKKK